MNLAKNLSVDGDVYRWSGSLNELKLFVEETLTAKGKWSSPGGSVKLFKDQESDLTIKWYGPQSQRIVVQADNNEHYSKLKFESLATIRSSKDPENGVMQEANNAMPRPAEVCNCACNCSGKVSAADIEGIKLDMAILESRLDTVNICNTVIFDLESLKEKQQAMEAIIRKQEEMICNLNDDNMFFKSKLMAFIQNTPIMLTRNCRNNTESATRAINTLHGLSDQDADLNATTNKSNLNNKEAIIKKTTFPKAVYIADDSLAQKTANPTRRNTIIS